MTDDLPPPTFFFSSISFLLCFMLYRSKWEREGLRIEERRRKEKKEKERKRKEKKRKKKKESK
jgi:hypothetical protein